MGRRKKEKTSLVRVRLTDIVRLKAIAKKMNLTIPDTISFITRKRK